MRCLPALTLALVLLPAAPSFAQPQSPGRTVDSSLEILEDDNEFFEIEVVIARWATPVAEDQRIEAPFKLEGPKADVIAEIEELQKANRLASVQRIRLVAPHNQQALVQVGGEQPRLTGSQFGPRGNTVNSISYSSVGTIVRVKPRSLSERRIAIDLEVSKSGLTQSPDAPVLGQDESRSVVKADSMRTLTVQTIAAVVDGQMIVVSGSQQPGEGELVLLSAKKQAVQSAK